MPPRTCYCCGTLNGPLVDICHICGYKLFTRKEVENMIEEAEQAQATAVDSAATTKKSRKKDYSYRSTWDHKLRRARNLARRGGVTKKEMMTLYGRFPKKNEWWGPEENEKEWYDKWVIDNPPY